jgi:hypothetical protein
MGSVFFIKISEGLYFSPGDTFIIKSFNSDIFYKNLLACIVWIKSYLTSWGFFTAAVVITLPFVLKTTKKSWAKFLIFISIIIIPLLAQSIIAIYFLPRYIFLSFALLLFFISRQLSFVLKYNKAVFSVSLLIMLISFAYFDLRIIIDSNNAPLHQNEVWQYISGSPSGWGVKEISEYISSNSLEASVASIGKRMMPASGLHYYLDNKNIKITEYGDINMKIDEEYLVFQKEMRNDYRLPQGYEKILEIKKPLGNTTVYLYKNLHLAKI